MDPGLAATETLLRLFDNSQVIMFRWRAAPGWPVEAVSRSVAQLGYAPEQFLDGSLPYASIVHPDDLQRVAAEVAAFTAAGVARFQQSYRLRSSDGAFHHIDDRTLVVRDAAGQVTHYEGTILDVTERQSMLEELVRAQKLEALGRLAGGVAHDFNNLLTVIQGHASLLADALAGQAQVLRHVERIGAAAERASAMTRQLLLFSRRQLVQAVRLDVGQVAAEVVDLLRPLLGERITVVLEPRRGPCPVVMDRSHLEQVVMNLLLNARDGITDRGTVTVDTRLQDPQWVQLSIRDDGVGMDPGSQARIFEPFFSNKGLGRAIGLGMAAVSVAIEQAGGQIEVRSRPGSGTEFVIRLPHSPGATAAQTDGAAQVGHGGSEHVLLVEDDELIRDLVGSELRSRGYQVTAARSAEEALHLHAAASRPVDLVVTDVVLPRISGSEMVARMRQRSAGLRALYISGYTEEVLAAPGGPGLAFLPKPFTPRALARRVRELLDAPLAAD